MESDTFGIGLWKIMVSCANVVKCGENCWYMVDSVGKSWKVVKTSGK